MASGRGAAHPATLGDGWWRRDVRLQYRPVFRTPDTPEPRPSWRPAAGEGPSLLIAGATGTLGKALARACEWRGVAYRLATRAELPLDRPDALRARLDEAQPWAVINAAGWVRVDDAEADEAGCFAANAAGAIDLARACAERGLGYVGYSSDLVFDGTSVRPYVESDPPAPLNAYGRSKAVAERGVLELGGQALMIRTAAFFSAFDPHNFAAHVVRTLSGDQRLSAAEDLIISPTYVPDLVDATLDLLIDGQTGLRHLANTGAVTWAAFARQLATALDLDPGLIDPTPSARLDRKSVV